jgi:ABC-type transporter Mla subunit MlaD
MRNRGGIQGLASNPILVGAVTVLVVMVAVFLAYNANNGLPFVSTYDLKARVPNADALVKGNEVRIGGVRVGIVESVLPVQLEDGEVAAELSLRLDQNVDPLPVDSTISIRPKSALGLKFLQVTPGDSSEGFEAGETIPVSAAKPEPVDIDEFFSMFDKKTRDAIRQNLAGFGNAFAGRGPQLNEAFGALRRLVVNGQPVLQTLVAPSTDFAGFWRALEALSATVAPVAETQASMFVALDQTFGAFARVSRPYIQETIEKSPGTLDVVNADLPALNPFLKSSERFFAALQPGAKALGETSPVIAQRLPSAERPAAADGGSARRLPGSDRGLQWPRPVDRHQPDSQARVDLHHPGPDRLQLRDPPVRKPGEVEQPGQQPGQVAQLPQL